MLRRSHSWEHGPSHFRLCSQAWRCYSVRVVRGGSGRRFHDHVLLGVSNRRSFGAAYFHSTGCGELGGPRRLAASRKHMAGLSGSDDHAVHSFLPARREMPTSPGSQPTMLVSFPFSLTRWSTRGAIRRRKQRGSQGHCCLISCPMIPVVRRHFRIMAGRLPTMSSITSCPSSPTGG